MENLQDRDVDIVFLTETWLICQKSDVTKKVRDYGYNINHIFRKTRGGGVGILTKSSLKVKPVTCNQKFTSLEHFIVSLTCVTGKTIVCVVIYRHQEVKLSIFLDEVYDLFVYANIISDTVIISGDINIHQDILSDPGAVKFRDILENFQFIQHVQSATHIKGHALDCVVTSPAVGKVTNLSIENLHIGDHFLITFAINFILTLKPSKIIKFRKLRDIDHDSFSSDLAVSLKFITTKTSNDTFEQAINDYNEHLENTLDKFAPVVTKVVKVVSSAPWFDTEYKIMRRERRQAERRWKKSGLPVHRDAFLKKRKETTFLAFTKKKEYYTRKFNNCNTNSQRSMYSFVNEIMDNSNETVLPVDCNNNMSLANNFNSAFVNKPLNIRNKILESSDQVHDGVNPNDSYIKFSGTCLSDFLPTTVDELREIIRETSVKSSNLDPFPGNLTKEYIDCLLPVWCQLVNLSLTTGSIDGIKTAEITPIFKAHGLDQEKLSNYRPISNLSFVGKLIERVVLKRLNTHMCRNNLHVDAQSGYKKQHSTETVLMKVTNDLLIMCDKKSATVMLMLDLSAAFDTVDHNKLLNILYHEIGLRGLALKWMKSFLVGRIQRVNIKGDLSDDTIILFGVPQGSVLGPVLFNIYIRSLYRIVDGINFNIQGYADDHQLYKSFTPIFQANVLVDMVPKCFSLISKWMKQHFLQLNADKTQIIIFGPERILGEINIGGVFLECGQCIRFRSVGKNLGVVFDSSLRFDYQISEVTQKCYLNLRLLYRIKSFLTRDQMKTLLCALVLSKIDYCNSLYYGINQNLIRKLQTVENAAARLIFGRRKRESAADLLNTLHWLPVRERIIFKLILTIFKCVHGLCPTYLSESITFTGARNCVDLEVPASNSAYGDRAFVIAGPRTWNALPRELRAITSISVFKKALKTYLYTNAGALHEKLNTK